MNHNELQDFTAVHPFGSMIVVVDRKAKKIWLITNANVAKLVGVDAKDINEPKDISAGRFEVRFILTQKS